MGFFSIDEAGAPGPGRKKDYYHEIPWTTDPRRIAFWVSSSLKSALSLRLLLIFVQH